MMTLTKLSSVFCSITLNIMMRLVNHGLVEILVQLLFTRLGNAFTHRICIKEKHVLRCLLLTFICQRLLAGQPVAG